MDVFEFELMIREARGGESPDVFQRVGLPHFFIPPAGDGGEDLLEDGHCELALDDRPGGVQNPEDH